LGISTGAVHLMHWGSGIAMAGAAAAVATNGLRLCPLGRSTLDALNTAKDLDARGVRIVITTLGIDLKTPAGRLVYGVLAQIAELAAAASSIRSAVLVPRLSRRATRTSTVCLLSRMARCGP